MRPASFFLVAADLLLLLTPGAQADATCYNVDGTESTDAAMAPCFPNADVSACCAINKGSRSDICLSSGLCYAQDNDYRGLIFMNGCTDSTGLSSDCPHLCPDGESSMRGVAQEEHSVLVRDLKGQNQTDSTHSEHKLERWIRGRSLERPPVQQGRLLLPGSDQHHKLLR